jgi:FixJ family two-component response regulator
MMSNDPEPGRLVVIDDDPHVLGALKFAFEADGYAVSIFSSGEAVLKDPPRESNTCFVIDQRLPGLSGLDTLARLRDLGVAAPAILVTTHPSADVRRRARLAAVDIVEKPLLGNVLPQKIAEALAR